MFAIRNAVGSPNTIPFYEFVNYIEIRVDQTPGNRFKFDGTNATYVMERDWNVVFKSEPTPGSTFDVKFYFQPEELMRLDAAFDALVETNPELVRMPLEWFKANQGNHVSFKETDILFTGIDSSMNITTYASQVFDENTGVSVNGAEFCTDTSAGNYRNYIEFKGLTSFSGGTGMIRGTNGGTTLPVKLVSLEAKAVDNEKIEVRWTTATEINNEGFEIHRSTDGVNFEKITWVGGNGSTTRTINYAYTDYEVKSNILYYYKLKQIDFDGQYEFSKIVHAKLSGSGIVASITLIPNPTRETGVIEIQSEVGENIQVRLIDMYGKTLECRQFVSEQSISKVQIGLSNFSHGVYNVVVQVGEDTNLNGKWVIF